SSGGQIGQMEVMDFVMQIVRYTRGMVLVVHGFPNEIAPKGMQDTRSLKSTMNLTFSRMDKATSRWSRRFYSAAYRGYHWARKILEIEVSTRSMSKSPRTQPTGITIWLGK
ncbi:conserved hypothetical protein, partial [Trichinella spiralis]|uniref:hypothetical protein n=1 Tax=Trichinella spiralis TaxID=6334 RepID=UPI0001EFD4BA